MNNLDYPRCLLQVIAAMFEFSMVHMLARKIRIGMQTGAIYPGHPSFPGYVDPNEVAFVFSLTVDFSKTILNEG